MPSIDDFANTNKKVKFTKTKFRPWNYNEQLLFGKNNEIDSEEKEKIISTQKVSHKESKSNQNISNKESIGNLKVIYEKSKSNLEGNQENSITEDSNYYVDIINKLSGLQRTLFFYIVDRTELRGNLQTGPILLDSLIDLTKTTQKTIKTALQRLIDKKLLSKNPNKMKRGKGGFRYYSISSEIKLIALEIKRIENIPSLILASKSNQKVSQMVINSPTSSSNYINNKNTTTNLPEEWLNINFIPLEHIGFTKTQLLQLYETNSCLPEGVQESINYLAFDLENNNLTNKYSDPLNVFMGTIRKGKLWSKPKDYKSPQEIVMEKLITRKKEENERIKRLEEEAYKLALDEWQESLSQEQLEEIAPVKKGKGDLMPQSVKLSMYFRENIWPGKKGEYLPN